MALNHTLRNLVKATFRKMNVSGKGSVLTAEDYQNALYALDNLTDMWSNEKLMVFSYKPFIFYTNPNQKNYTLGPATDTPGQVLGFGFPILAGGSGYTNGTYKSVPLTGGTGTNVKATITVNEGTVINVLVTSESTMGLNYTVGDQLSCLNTHLGGSGSGFLVEVTSVTPQTDWVVTRPMKIEKAYTIWNDPVGAQAVDIPIQILTMEQYAAIGVKNTPSTFGMALYDNGDWPTRTITLFPVPTTQTGIRLWLRQPLIDASMESLDEPINYPPGYEQAFVYNLAVQLAAEYMKSLTPETMQMAVMSKEALKAQNQNPVFMRGDGGLNSGSGAGYNYISGYPAIQVVGGGWWG